MNHYFRLHFVCQPGGSRKTEYYVFGTLAEVHKAALADLNSPMGAYHALFYGEEIVLQCWENGRKIAAIDLHPFIHYRLSDRDEPVTFSGPGDGPALEMDDDEEDLVNSVLDEVVTVKATVDWGAIEMPALGGTPLPKGSPAVFEDDEPWKYGVHNEWDTYL